MIEGGWMDGWMDRGEGELLTCQLMSCAGALISHVLQWMQLSEVRQYQLLLHENKKIECVSTGRLYIS